MGNQAVIRIVGRSSHVDGDSILLTEDAVQQDDLCGKLDGEGNPRTFSVVWLCRCDSDHLNTAIGVIRRDNTLPEDPGGAAALVSQIVSIDYKGNPAFKVFDHPDNAIPHHASILFEEVALKASKTDRRLLRRKLIKVLGHIRAVHQARDICN